MSEHDEAELHHQTSETGKILAQMELHGWRHDANEPDPRTVPEDYVLAGAVSDIFGALVSSLGDSALEPDLAELLWSSVNALHRAAARIERQLDDNEQAQRRLQAEQDGTEVKSVELERLLAGGDSLLMRRDALELMRDEAAEHFARQTGSVWKPRTGSNVNRRALTAAMIDSREFIAARKRADAEVLLPKGTRIALTGGLDFNDHELIWSRLDTVHARHPDMVLLHGGSPRGAELIAARWADTRKVPQIVFRPDWAKHGRSAPFRRNDSVLEILPVGVLHFPGSGVQDNFRDKARALGIPVWSCPG